MFDVDPKDEVESYPCPKCKTGTFEQNVVSGNWVCDKCDFECEPNDEDKL